MEAQKKQKRKFKVIRLSPYVISVWGNSGYLSLRVLLRNLCNKNFSVRFLKNNKEILSDSDKVKMSDDEIINNLIFLYSLDFETIKEEYDSIKLFLSENLIRFSDEKFQRKYSREFFKRFSHIDDIWLEV